MSRWLYCMVFLHHFRKNSLLSIQVIYTHLEANENKKSQAAQMALLYWNSHRLKHFLLMKTVEAVSYHASSCHTERGFILTTWSSVNHLVGLSHIEPEADGPTVELTMLMLRNWKKVVTKHRENNIFDKIPHINTIQHKKSFSFYIETPFYPLTKRERCYFFPE